MLARFDAVEGDCPFVAVAYAGVAVVVSQVFYYELLAYVYHLVHSFARDVYQLYCELTRTDSQHLRFEVKAQSCYRAAVVTDFVVDLVLLNGFDLENAEIGAIVDSQIAVSWVDVAEGLPSLALAGFFHALDLNESMRADVLCNFEGVEDVFGLESGNEMLFGYVGLVELITVKVVLFHVAVLFGFFEFV